MLQKLVELGHVYVLGMQLYVWVLLGAVGLMNEIVERMKWTTAGSLLQAGARFVLNFPVFGPVLVRLPYVGIFLNWVAKKKADDNSTPPPVPPPAPAPAPKDGGAA